MKIKIPPQKEQELVNFWKNMMNGIFYVKGERDTDAPNERWVLATRKGNIFGPDNCYFSQIKDLPPGTVYVTAD